MLDQPECAARRDLEGAQVHLAPDGAVEADLRRAEHRAVAWSPNAPGDFDPWSVRSLAELVQALEPLRSLDLNPRVQVARERHVDGARSVGIARVVDLVGVLKPSAELRSREPRTAGHLRRRTAHRSKWGQRVAMAGSDRL